MAHRSRIFDGNEDILRTGLVLFRDEHAGDLFAAGIQEGQGLAPADRSADLRFQLRVAGVDDRRAHLLMDRVQRFLFARIVAAHGAGIGVVQAAQLLDRVQRLRFEHVGIFQHVLRLEAELLVQSHQFFFVRLRHKGDAAVVVRLIQRGHLFVDLVQLVQKRPILRSLQCGLRQFVVNVLECFQFVRVCHGNTPLQKAKSFLSCLNCTSPNPTNVQQRQREYSFFFTK